MHTGNRVTNNFDGLRLAAAAAVVIGHAFVLTGAGSAPSVFGFTIHKLGVAVFFCISGYLIAGSWFRARSAPRYLWHRFLRIIPALWVLVLLTTFVIGPLVTEWDLSAYFGSSMTYEYLLNLTTAATYRLPGVFVGHVNPAVNGSLWTIGVEVMCYLALLGIALLCRRYAGWGFGVMAIVMAIASVTVATDGEWLAALSDAAPVTVYFFAGALMKSLERSGRIAWKPAYAAVSVVAWGALSLAWPSGALVSSWLFLPLCVIPMGAASWPLLRLGGRFGDASYGVYLWGFLVQQIVIQFLGVLPLIANTLIVLAVTVALAFVSCHLIERPALQLKDWTPNPRAPLPALSIPRAR